MYVPLPKKGDLAECSNYRTIALISQCSKVLLKIIQKRLEPNVERELPDEQAGFRRDRGCRDQIANMRWIMATCKEFSRPISMCFIDYSKAFDCVDHNLMWRYLREMGVPEHLVMLLHNLYEGQKATVRTEQGCCEQFDVKKGVRQGCILSPPLFNLYSEQIMRNAGIKDMTEGVKVGGRNVNNLRYADDTTLLAETAPYLKELLERVKVESLKSGLALNIKKTKVMSTEELNEFTIGNKKIEAVEQVNLLGSVINRTNDCSQEVRRRLALGRASMDNMKCVWRNKSIAVETKVRLVRALVFSVVLYGSES